MAKKNIPYDQKYYDPEIECMPRPELEQMQLERLQEMVQYAYDNTVYYKRSFDEAGVAPSDIKTLKDLEKFPFIDKKTERETQPVSYTHLDVYKRQTVSQAREYIAQGQFAPGSMLPKVEACIDYVEKYPEGKALITSLECAAAGLRGETGTVIVA